MLSPHSDSGCRLAGKNLSYVTLLHNNKQQGDKKMFVQKTA